MIFTDRKEAGELLAKQLNPYANQKPLLYALPRGGVVVAKPIADALKAPLEPLVTRKIGYPESPECALAAVSESGQIVSHHSLSSATYSKWIKSQIQIQKTEIERQKALYLQKPAASAGGRVAIIIDDGIATGLTLEAAILELKQRKPKKIVVAVPVAPLEAAERIKSQVDDFVALEVASAFLGAVGAYYRDFSPVSDEEVISCLK